MTRVAFFGTGNFAAKILTALLADKNYSVDLVITQPDRKVGRKQIIEPSPVKTISEQHKLSIFQPESLKKNFEPSILDGFDLSIVCQYGLIIPQNILDIPKHKSLNVHASLLPKYRGASPVQTVLINGEKTTGITIILMDAKMDHGPMLAQTEISIEPDDTYPALSDRLSDAAIPLLLQTMDSWINKKITPQPQNENQATFCQILNREDGRIDFSKNSDEIYNQYRGLFPWPGIWTILDGKRLKLTKISKASNNKLPSGEIYVTNNNIYLGCGNNTSIELLEAQLEGKNNLTATQFLNGMRHINGKTLK